MRFRYDVGTQETAPAGVDMNLRMSLQFQRRPGESDSDLLRSRFYGDLRRAALRLHGQFVPWQPTAAGASPPRDHDVQLGADFAPPRAPRLGLNYSRLDRDRADGRAQSDDRRADVSYALGGLGAEIAFRRLEAQPAGRDPIASKTKEWHGGLHGAGSLGSLSGQGAYDALISDFRQRERHREFTSHGVNLGASWNPIARFTLSASALGRWGRTDDNALPSDRSIDERYVSGDAQVRPLSGLDLSLLSESRRRKESGSDASADYLQFQGNLRRPIREGFFLQTGFARTVTLESSQGEVPNSSAYAFVEGRMRKGIDGRAELRGSSSSDESAGTQWHRLVQLRTRPRSTTRLDVTWSKDTLPIAIIERRVAGPADSSGTQVDTLTVIPGVAQQDHQWEITGGYDPRPGATVVASLRLLDGAGRIDRSERLTTVTATWRAARRTTLSWNWSWRRARSAFETTVATIEVGLDTVTTRVETETTEIVRGIDVTGRLPGEFRVIGSWRSASGSGREGSVTYSVTLDRNF